MAAGSAVSGLVTGQWLALAQYASRPFDKNGALGIVIAGVSNITVFGEDWVMFLSHPLGAHLHLTSDFRLDRFPLWRYLLIPQAWSVGVELCFYLLAPFLCRRRTKTVIAIATLSLGARLAAYAGLGLTHDPWTYRFFPFELFSFSLGILAFRCYEEARKSIVVPAMASTFRSFVVTSIVSLITFYWGERLVLHFSHGAELPYGWLLTYPIWSAVIVGLFLVSRSNKYDRLVGELSFPIYLVHYFVIPVVGPIAKAIPSPHHWLGPLSALVSIAVAVLLYRTCIEPLDRKRHVLTVSAPRSVLPPILVPAEA